DRHGQTDAESDRPLHATGALRHVERDHRDEPVHRAFQGTEEDRCRPTRTGTNDSLLRAAHPYYFDPLASDFTTVKASVPSMLCPARSTVIPIPTRTRPRNFLWP